MDIKKLRKKWDNIDSSNLIKNKVENVRTAQQRVESEQIKKQVDNLYNKNEQTSTNTWQKVVNKANAIMNDTKQFSKNFALGAERGGISALGQTEFLSQQQFQGYRKQQSILTEARKNETVEGKLQEANRKYDEAKMINGVAISKQADINESGTMQFFNKKQEDIDKKMAENTEKTQTTLGRYYTGNVAPSLGQSTVGTVLDIVAPGMGSGYRMLSYGGNYTQDALATGKMNERQSAMYGMTMAGVETAMDTAMDIAKGKLIGETKKATGFKDWLKVSAKELGINSTFEGIGEALTEPLQEVVKEVYGGEADFENIWQRMGQSFVAGVASEALMEGASAGYGGAVNVMNKIQNGQQVSTTEIANALKEINQKEEIDIEKLLVKRFEMTAQELYKNTDVQKNTDTKLENMAEDISKSDYRKIKANQLIEESDLDDTQKEVAKEIANEYVFSEEETKKLIDYAKNNINAEKQQTTIENKPLLNKEQQTTSEQGKMAENTTSKQPLGNDKYSIKMPDSNFKYEKTGNVNEDLLDESMSKVFNNSEDTMKLNKTLKQIMKDKNVSIVFEENITDSQGNILDGKYENGKIIINPNSTRAFEHIATHELTHAIGTKEMLKLVEKYRSSDKVFEGKLKTLLKNYNKTELTEEALAEVSGQLFGTQEFINNVKNTNPNLFQKIYSEIKYLWHQLRGYKNESQFIDDLYYKWTQAYNSNAELNQTTKNMVGARETKYTKGTQEEAINRIKNGEKPADVYEDTGWYVGIEGDKVKTIISDSKSDLTMDLVNAKKYYNQDVKLSDILKHEDLYEVYPELKDVKVEVYRFDDEKTGKDIYDVGAKYVKGKSIDINLNYIDTLVKNGKTSELLGAVLHEVQHWVQNKEGFETGSSRQLFDELKNDITKVEKIVQNAEQEYKQYDKEYKTLKNKITEKLFREGKYSAKEVEKQLKEQFDMDKYEQLKDKATKYSNFLKQLNYYESKEMYNLSSGEKESEFTRKNMRLPQGVVTAEDVLNYFNSNDVLANTAKEIYNTIYGGGNNVIHYNQSSYRDRNNRYGGRQSDKIAKYDEANRENIGTQFGKDITRNKGNESDFRGTADKNNREIQGLEESSSFNLQKNKEKQLEIIQKNNPLDESLGNHTWITSVDDIKTYKEALEYDEYEGGNLTPDFKEEDLNKALETGEMTVYSSYPIEQGIFVTPSKMEAQNYAGSGKVYSKKIKLSDVAWIDSLQGQYAKVDDSKYAKQGNTEWQEYLEENFKTEGTRTTKEQIRLPERNVLQENTSNLKQTTTKKETDTEIAKVLNTPVTRQKPQDRKWAIFKASVFDKGIVFEDLSKRAKNRELEAKWDYTLSSSARAQYAIGNARFDENGNKISKGLTEIIDEVGDKIDDFQNYMYHLLNIDRMTLKDRFGIDNKPVFGKNIGKDYSERAVAEFEKNNPEFKEWAQDVYDYANADKAELVKNGVISQELADKFSQMYPHYVPIQRANKINNAISLPLDTRRTGVNTPIKQAKGGSSDLNPLFETLAGRTMQTYRASGRNSLGVELKNTLQTLNSLNATTNDMESIDSIVDTISDEKTTSELLQASKDGKLPTFTVFDNGNKVTFEISEDIYDALKPMDSSSLLNKKSKILNTIGNLRRAILTEYNPLFSITNTIKDTQDVLMNSQHATKTYLKYPEAYWQILTGGYWKQEYIQNGGEQNTYFKDGEFEKVTKKGMLKKVITFPLDTISKINSVIEMAPRLAEYIASREEGRSIQTSMLDASRVTTNFKAGGDFTKALNRNGATFLNAGVQGAMQTVRNIREANVKGLKGWTILACKMAVAGAPVLLLNNLIWEDDEEYEQLQDYVKDSYYIIGKRDDGTFIRIPKGRTLAVIQKIVGNVDKYKNNKQELNIDNVSKDFWESIKFGIENLAPNNPIDNNIFSPIFQAITNKSWYGEDIVPERLQDVPTREQYDETTDKFSKWLGEKTGISPMKINYLLDQYGGGVSDVLLPLGTPQAENTPLEDKFTTDPVMKSKYPGEFFEKSDELKVASNSMYASDTDIIKDKYMSEIQGEMSELYKEKRKIQNSTDSDEIKKRKLKEVQRQINDLAKESMEVVETATANSKTGKIGDNQYYKDDEGKWQKIKESQVVKGLDTETYADFKNKTAVATDKKRVEKGNDKAQLNNSEKCEILINSNYTDDEKKKIYKNYIGDSDEIYDNLETLTKGKISINDYLDYKTADIEGVDDPNSLIKGKTISGSKKKNLLNFLKNSDFSTIERIYIKGTNNTLDSNEKAMLESYVNGLGLTNAERKAIYKKIKNYQELEDGRYRLK